MGRGAYRPHTPYQPGGALVRSKVQYVRSNMMVRSFTKVFFFCLLSLVSLAILPAVSSAAGPAWVSGFPKLVQKNAMMQWVPVKGAAEYKVYRSEEKGKAPKAIGKTKSNNYIDKDIPSGKTCYYSISAVVSGKEGERSSEGAVSVAAEKVFVPVKVPNLIAPHLKELSGGKYAVGMRWEGKAGTDLVSISVYRSETKGKDYAMIGSSMVDSYDDKDVQQGKTYYYVITAVDSQFKETKYSNEVKATIPVAEKVEAAAAKAIEKTPPTKMRSVKLLFRITDDRKKDYPLGTVLDVCVDEAVGHIYAASMAYGGVLVYDMEGRLQFGIRKDGVSGTVKIKTPRSLAIGDGGDLYVTDFDSPDIEVFDMAGRHKDTIKVDISGIAKAKGKAAKTFGVAVSDDGTVYVTDIISDSLFAYDRKGKRVMSVTGALGETYKERKDQPVFNGPGQIAITKGGDIVFVNTGYQRLEVFGADGSHKGTIGKPGRNAGELDLPIALASYEGNIFVADAQSPNIQAFSSEGKFQYALSNDKADGPPDVITNIRGIAIDGKGRLYVAEGGGNRVSVFQLGDEVTEISAETIEKKK